MFSMQFKVKLKLCFLKLSDPMVADQRVVLDKLIVEAQVHYSYNVLDYCRFVRIDGLGNTLS